MRTLLLLVLLLCGCLSRPAPAESLQQCCGVVLIDGQQQGSAAIVSAEGLVLSAAHVVRGRDGRISWFSESLGHRELNIVALDPAHDLALLKLSGSELPLAHLDIARREAAPGEEAWLYGNPMMRRDYLVPGRWGMTAPQCIYLPDQKLFAELRPVTGAAVPGFSGGPWVNGDGEVCGVQSAIILMSQSSVGLSHAAPLDAIRSLVAKPVSTSIGDLGLIVDSLYESSPAERRKIAGDALDGAVVRSLQKSSPCRDQIQVNDVITAVDGDTIVSSGDLIQKIRRFAPGHKFKITLRRDGRQLEAEILSTAL
ncbi:MAG: putative periplasmic serine endoprotease DegP-like precursor [Verrucomicrobiota bacterium]|jgi:S1-C subfamily serine protease